MKRKSLASISVSKARITALRKSHRQPDGVIPFGRSRRPPYGSIIVAWLNFSRVGCNSRRRSFLVVSEESRLQKAEAFGKCCIPANGPCRTVSSGNSRSARAALCLRSKKKTAAAPLQANRAGRKTAQSTSEAKHCPAATGKKPRNRLLDYPHPVPTKTGLASSAARARDSMASRCLFREFIYVQIQAARTERRTRLRKPRYECPSGSQWPSFAATTQ